MPRATCSSFGVDATRVEASWACRGGFIDVGESGEEAERREIAEEVGPQIDELSYLTSYPNAYAHGGLVYQVIDFFYLAEVPHFGAAHPNAREVREWFIARPGSVKAEGFAFSIQLDGGGGLPAAF